MGYKVIPTWDDVFVRNCPYALFQGITGYIQWATFSEEQDIFTGENKVVAFFMGETDRAEVQLDPNEYGKKWRCIAYDDDPEPYEIGMKFPFVGGL